MAKKPFHFTVVERILIHLAPYAKYEDSIEVPFSVTQQGIADAVCVQRSAVPRAMKKIIQQGWGFDRLAHVQGQKRRRTVYFLTMEGMSKSKQLIDNVRLMKIRYEAPSGMKKH